MIGCSFAHKASPFIIMAFLCLFMSGESPTSKRKFDDQATHNVTSLIILLWTVGMTVMAGHASRT